MRTAWAFVGLLVTAGCLSEPTPPPSAGGLTVRGLVLDAFFAPIPGAVAVLLMTNETATTGPDGTFSFNLVGGESALVTVTATGFEPATRRVSLTGGDGFVEVVLAALPVAEPYSVAVEHAGFISCAMMARIGGEGSTGPVATCGERDPNDQRELSFEIPVADGVAGVVLELSWKPGNPLAARFAFSATAIVNGTERPLGGGEGDGYVKLLIPRSVAREVLGPGAVLRTRTEPAASLLDEEAFAGAGFALAQPFTVIATVFYNAPPPPAYRAGGAA